MAFEQATLQLGQAMRCLEIDVSTALTGSEQDTGYDLPSKAIVWAVAVQVTTAEATGATKTLDIGLLSSESGGDADGLVDGVSVSATGFKQPEPQVTVGGTETYFASAQIIGALFRAGFKAGSNSAGDTGILALKPFLTDSVTAKSVSVTSGSAFTEFRGKIFIFYTPIVA